ncbi:MAG: hypothetical protein JWN00_2503 [Actinomycetia bacterium]|nr:hypothetical protein [Actinomycetes bacterium]
MAPPTKSSFKVNTLDCPSGQWNGGYDEFKALGDKVDPGALANVAVPYMKAQSLLITTYEELTTQAYRLVDGWTGDASAEFQKNLQALYVSACNLADATGQVGIAIGYHVSDLQTLKQNVDTMKPADQSGWQIAGDIASIGIYNGAQDNNNAAGDAVKKWMNTDLAHSTTTYTFGELPTDVRTETPNPSTSIYKPTTLGGTNTGGGGGLGGNSGGIPKLTSPTTKAPTPTPTIPTPTPTHTPTPTPIPTPTNHVPTPTVPHTNLAHFTPPGSGSGGGFGGGGLGNHGGLGGGGGGLGSGGLGSGGLNSAGGLGSSGLNSAGGLGGGALSADAAAAREAALARSGGAAGANGMPMGMGGGGQEGQKEERERTTWLTEDDDVWGGDGDVAPPIIG